MAEENKNMLLRGVVVEFDFTAVDGAELLFKTAQKVLKEHDVDLTVKLEAMRLVGGNYQGGLSELFESLGVKGDSAKVAQKLSEAFREALGTQAVQAVTPEFKAFVKALVDRGVKVVVATRSDVEPLKAALAEFDPALVVTYAEPSNTYGNCKWDAWRRACSQNGLIEKLTAAVTGSGKGVKSALVAGMSALAIVHDHVAYQDFGGADAVAEKFDASLADVVFRMLHME
jgi:beta-phosphoglucomutase-like phosphatase (HAD superfamily)